MNPNISGVAIGVVIVGTILVIAALIGRSAVGIDYYLTTIYAGITLLAAGVLDQTAHLRHRELQQGIPRPF